MFGDPYQNFGWGGLLDQWNTALEVARAAFQQQPGAHMPRMGEPQGGAGGLGNPTRAWRWRAAHLRAPPWRLACLHR
jgi:hypothetical protein